MVRRQVTAVLGGNAEDVYPPLEQLWRERLNLRIGQRVIVKSEPLHVSPSREKAAGPGEAGKRGATPTRQ